MARDSSNEQQQQKTVKILRITRYEHSLIVSPRPVLSSDKTTKVKKKKIFIEYILTLEHAR